MNLSRAVVTGGAGFIGSNLVDALVNENVGVLVVDDLSRGTWKNLECATAGDVELLECDVRDGERLKSAFCAFGPDVVFHLAAQIDVRTSMVAPAVDASVNVLGSINVMSASLAAGARRVVNTSTGGAIYSPTAPIPTPETAPSEPLSAYGLSKHAAETYGDWFRRTHDLDVVTLRYGNVYGPRQDPRGDAGVIAIFCDAALNARRPTIFGDGGQTRDFVYVGDIVAANLAAASASALSSHVFNVGTGSEISVLELAEAVAAAAEIAHEDFTSEFAPARPGEVRRSCLDVQLARSELGLGAPTPLIDGLRRTLAWIQTL